MERDTRQSRSPTRMRHVNQGQEHRDNAEERETKRRCMLIPRCVMNQVRDGGRTILCAWEKLASNIDEYTEHEIMIEVEAFKKLRP